MAESATYEPPVTGREAIRIVKKVVIAVVAVVVLLVLAFVPLIQAERPTRHEVTVEGFQPEVHPAHEETVCVRWVLLWCAEYATYTVPEKVSLAGTVRIRNNEADGEFVITVSLLKNGTLQDTQNRRVYIYEGAVQETYFEWTWLESPALYEVTTNVDAPKVLENVSVFAWVWGQVT